MEIDLEGFGKRLIINFISVERKSIKQSKFNKEVNPVVIYDNGYKGFLFW